MLARRIGEKGAAAVEMAIVLPLLLMVIGGIVDLGRAFYTQITFSNAAREGARMVALGYSDAQRDQRITESFRTGTGWAIVSSAACPATNPLPTQFGEVVLRPNPEFRWMMLDAIPGVSVTAPQIRARGTMRCAG